MLSERRDVGALQHLIVTDHAMGVGVRGVLFHRRIERRYLSA